MDSQSHDDFGKNFFIGFFIILILIVFIIATATYLYYNKPDLLPDFFKKSIKEKKEEFIPPNRYTISIYPKIDGIMNFKIKNQTNVIYKGLLKGTTIEQFTQGSLNVTYFIEGQSDLYYYTRIPCTVTKNNTRCPFEPRKKAIVSLFLTETEFTIDPYEGIIQDPLICIAWGLGTSTITLKNMNQISIPNRLKWDVDICYSAGHDITERTTFFINKENYNSDKDLIKFFVIDKEINKFGKYSYNVDTGIPDKIKTIIS